MIPSLIHPARLLLILTLFIPVLAGPVAADEGTKLLRYPDIHGDQVVFTYAGDLWLASSGGGTARRLTSHPGVELFAKFSPDGSQVAFTGQYDGDEQVYVVETSGGAPRQLTFYPALGPLPPRWGYDHHVYGWSPDGSKILFRSLQDAWDIGEAHLFTVDRDGGLPERLPMPGSGAGAFSPDGSQIVYSPLFRDFRHWKRYRGGWAQNLWIYDLESDQARQLTDHEKTERDPMWIGDRVYFSADWTGTLQLYGVDPASGEPRQLTDHTDWDARWPSADEAHDQIIFELAGGLRVLDLASGDVRPLTIEVPSDQLSRRAEYKKVDDLISDSTVAPGGKRVAFSARGDIYSVPVERGPTRNLTRSSGAFDREPTWSPDGRHIAFVSDQDGEEEIWQVAPDGHGEPEQLTDGHATRFSGLLFSPDGGSLAFRDAGARLHLLDLESRELRVIADDTQKFGLSYAFSPGGDHLAFSLADSNGLRSIHVWSRADGEVRRVTGERANDYSPSFGAGGDYLFFLSDRQYQPQIGSIEWNYVVDRETYVYALALREDVDHLFAPRSDEAETGPEPKGDGDEKKDKKEAAEKAGDDKGGDEKDGENGDGEKKDGDALVIDFDGLEQRIVRVPVEAENYGGLTAVEGQLVYFKGAAQYYGRGPASPPEILLYDLDERQESSLVTGLQGASLSPDRKHLLVRQGGGWQLYPVKKGGSGQRIDVSRLGTEIDPVAEWRQIFDDAWRRFRDFFYVENMHGYDWQALRDRYRPLIAHVAHRSDLNYLISEMIAELNVSHAYVTGGDIERPERATVPLLGGRLAYDADAGAYRVERIFEGDNAEDNYRSPLREVGVDVEVGDYVWAIDGQPLGADSNPYEVLRHADPDYVELTVSKTPSRDDAERVVIRPVRSEDDLLYMAWTEDNRRRVAEATDGRVGYLHLPDMGASGIREWIKNYYPQIDKEGLIIDVRSNGGGNISPMIIERLERELSMVDFERHTETTDPVPNRTFVGHLAALINETTASDGDQFAWVFQQKGLGPLIGKRSWGGVVGIYGNSSLIDGGGVSIPEAGSGSPEGEWIIEGYGVDPDIEVENDPASLVAGRDPQLERAIAEVWAKVQAEPRGLPERPAPPVKTE